MYITQYEGDIIGQLDIATMRPFQKTHLATWSARNTAIDGLRSPVIGRGAGSFANHSDNPNACLVKTLFGVFLRATRAIRRGQWINVSYGKAFIKSRLGKSIHKRCGPKVLPPE